MASDDSVAGKHDSAHVSDIEIAEQCPTALSIVNQTAANTIPAVSTAKEVAQSLDQVTAATGTNLLDQIAALKAEQKELRAKKKKVSQTLRNAERRRSRLRKKAKLLSDADLVDVLRMRATAPPVQSSSEE